MLLSLPAALERIVRDLRDSGFHAVVVGGSVRDALLGLEPKDIDIEVYRISYDELAAFLATPRPRRPGRQKLRSGKVHRVRVCYM